MPAIPEFDPGETGDGLFFIGLALCIIGITLIFVLGSRFYWGFLPCVPGLILMAVDAAEHDH